MTAFKRFGPIYRFSITSRNKQIQISLVDLTTSKKWSTRYLDEEAYIDPKNRIPGATVDVYVKLFKETLEYLMNGKTNDSNGDRGSSSSSSASSSDSSDDSSDEAECVSDAKLRKTTRKWMPAKMRRKLTPADNGGFELEMKVMFRSFKSTWSTVYGLKLDPVPTKRGAMLEERLEDMVLIS